MRSAQNLSNPTNTDVHIGTTQTQIFIPKSLQEITKTIRIPVIYRYFVTFKEITE